MDEYQNVIVLETPMGELTLTDRPVKQTDGSLHCDEDSMIPFEVYTIKDSSFEFPGDINNGEILSPESHYDISIAAESLIPGREYYLTISDLRAIYHGVEQTPGMPLEYDDNLYDAVMTSKDDMTLALGIGRYEPDLDISKYPDDLALTSERDFVEFEADGRFYIEPNEVAPHTYDGYRFTIAPNRELEQLYFDIAWAPNTKYGQAATEEVIEYIVSSGTCL